MLSPALQSQTNGYPLLDAPSGEVSSGVRLLLIGRTSSGAFAALFTMVAG